MRLDESHEMNRALVERFRSRNSSGKPVAPPDSHPDPYMQSGSHPDIVERVWDALGSSLPVDCRVLVYGRPSLVHPGKGVVMAVAYGTAYAMRIPVESIREALKAGCTIKRRWTGGQTTNIQDEFGLGWVFGFWLEREKQWLSRVFADLGIAQ